jgi:hypothetical protein
VSQNSSRNDCSELCKPVLTVLNVFDPKTLYLSNHRLQFRWVHCVVHVLLDHRSVRRSSKTAENQRCSIQCKFDNLVEYILEFRNETWLKVDDFIAAFNTMFINKFFDGSRQFSSTNGQTMKLYHFETEYSRQYEQYVTVISKTAN